MPDDKLHSARSSAIVGGMLDSTLSFFLRGLRLRSRELKPDEALKAAAELPHFFAVELLYKGVPIRLIVASSAAPDGFELKPRAETPAVTAPPELCGGTVREKLCPEKTSRSN